MPLIVDTDRRATCLFSLKLVLGFDMNQVWIKYDGSKFYTNLEKTDHDGWRTCSGPRKHSNISPFMILRTMKNFRRFHRLNKGTGKYYMEKSKMLEDWENLRDTRKVSTWWKHVNVAREFRVFVSFYVAPRKCCVQKYSTAITFRPRWETMSTDMSRFASLRSRLLTITR